MSGNNTVGTLSVEVQLELSKMQAQMETLDRKVKSQARQLNSEWSRMARSMGAALNSIIPALSVGAVVSFGKAIVNNASQISDMASAANVGVEQFQALQAVAANSGVSVDQLSRALVTLQDKTQQAADGNQQAQDSFRALGLEWVKVARLSPELQLEAVAKAIVSADNPAKAFSASLDLLGTKNAPRLMEALRALGTDGFNKLEKDMKDAGLVLDKYYVEKLDGAGDKAARIWKTVSNAAAKVAVETMDAFSRMNPETHNYFASVESGVYSIESNQAAATAEMEKRQDALFENAKKRAREMRLASGTLPYDGTVGPSRIQVRLDKRDQEFADRLERELPELWQKTERRIRETDEALNDFFGDMDEQSRKTSMFAAMDEFFKPLDEAEDKLQKMKNVSRVFEDSMARMFDTVGDRASSMFADMLMEGRASFSELANIVARSAIEITARLAIVNPIMNMLFSGMAGFTALPSFFGGARAAGGPVSAGKTYLVGEEGPELLTPSFSGTIIPNGTTIKAQGARSGETFNISYNIAAGVSRQELIPALAASNKAVVAQITDMMARGGRRAQMLGA